MTVFTKKIFFILFLFTSFLLRSQNNSRSTSEFNFVDYNKNFIHFYNKHSNFNTFFGKLETLLTRREGKVKILQIGGSHIQAEVWPDQVRKNFLQLAPNINGGRGFVFPFKIAETWNPKNFQISYTGEWKSFRNSVKKHRAKWGVSGITAKTTDSIASFQIQYRDATLTRYKFNRIKVFHNLDTANYKVELTFPTAIKINTNREIGYTEFILEEEQDSLSVSIQKTQESLIPFNLYGLSLENDTPGIVYTSLGVNGAKTSSFLRNELFVDQLKVINPDLIIFCIGINDAYYPSFCPESYEKNYDQLIDWIKSVNPKAAFLFVTNNDSYYKKKYPNKRVFKARESLIKLAQKHNSGMWDLFGVMGGLGSIKKWENKGFAKKDKIHFTRKGYELIGDILFSALIKEYDAYLKLNNNKPSSKLKN